ncbi:hypothetical protein BV22DRAFT_103690 [Leucogyrophana mollusca]|uniref:Uncharacterized protein n=1 Tax=Leucogyrophana mollusca TaxID=85980 RepID=A0ACB8BXW1_9AGAM|nr:hypothetical protein BV22DRAFT_103690 [Leucogyrophana mollusca]
MANPHRKNEGERVGLYLLLTPWWLLLFSLELFGDDCTPMTHGFRQLLPGLTNMKNRRSRRSDTELKHSSVHHCHGRLLKDKKSRLCCFHLSSRGDA